VLSNPHAAALESARWTTRLQLSGIGEYLFTCRDLVLSPCRTRTGGGIRLLVVLVRTWLGDAGSGLMGQRATERVGLGWALLDDGPARKAALAIQTGRATMTMTAYFTTRPVVDIGQSTLLLVRATRPSPCLVMHDLFIIFFYKWIQLCAMNLMTVINS